MGGELLSQLGVGCQEDSPVRREAESGAELPEQVQLVQLEVALAYGQSPKHFRGGSRASLDEDEVLGPLKYSQGQRGRGKGDAVETGGWYRSSTEGVGHAVLGRSDVTDRDLAPAEGAVEQDAPHHLVEVGGFGPLGF